MRGLAWVAGGAGELLVVESGERRAFDRAVHRSRGLRLLAVDFALFTRWFRHFKPVRRHCRRSRYPRFLTPSNGVFLPRRDLRWRHCSDIALGC